MSSYEYASFSFPVNGWIGVEPRRPFRFLAISAYYIKPQRGVVSDSPHLHREKNTVINLLSFLFDLVIQVTGYLCGRYYSTGTSATMADLIFVSWIQTPTTETVNKSNYKIRVQV